MLYIITYFVVGLIMLVCGWIGQALYSNYLCNKYGYDILEEIMEEHFEEWLDSYIHKNIIVRIVYKYDINAVIANVLYVIAWPTLFVGQWDATCALSDMMKKLSQQKVEEEI